MIKSCFHAYCYLYYRLLQSGTKNWNGNKLLGDVGASNVIGVLYIVNIFSIIMALHIFLGILLLPTVAPRLVVVLFALLSLTLHQIFIFRKKELLIAKYKSEDSKQRVTRGCYCILFIACTLIAPILILSVDREWVSSWRYECIDAVVKFFKNL